MDEQILYVEDDQDNRILVEYYLRLHGYNVTSASTAAEAKRIKDTQLFDAYILDKRLPDKSGIDLCRYICGLDESAIVIFFSASAFPFDREQGIAAGAKAYLIKPNDFIRLPEVVNHFLHQNLFNEGLAYSQDASVAGV